MPRRYVRDGGVARVARCHRRDNTAAGGDFGDDSDDDSGEDADDFGGFDGF